jgi:hypothetical protein
MAAPMSTITQMIQMKHRSSTSLIKPIFFAMTPLILSGCSSLWSIDEEAPPPPPIKAVRQLQIPADLRVMRPALSPYTAALVAAQPTVTPPASNTPAAVPAPLTEPAPVTKTAEPLLFAPYFPTKVETKYPETWDTQPQYPFPWVMGASPSRVNEETVLGSGDRMMGRLFARVSYEKLIPVAGEPMLDMQAKPEVIPPEPEQGKAGFLSKLKKTVMGESKAPKAPKAPEPPAPVMLLPRSVVCEGATCLDAARDALMFDAKIKGWELLLSRRVSLHQSFQFRKNDRITLVEVHSDGKKTLDIEYGLLPTQNAVAR